MASPQLENGHTQIANEILEHLMRLHLAPNHWQVLLCVIRKTYGFHKKVDHIANSQIVEATGLCKAVVSRTLHNLSDMRVIDRKGKLIGFQKDWEKWQKLAELQTNDRKLAGLSTIDSKLAELQTNEDTQKLAIPSTQLAISSTKVSSPAVAQKIKDTIQKKTTYVLVPGHFGNVSLTEEEYQKLVTAFGDAGAKDRIEGLSLYIKSHGAEKKYKSHYATILNWERMERKKGNPPRSTRHLETTEELKHSWGQK